MVFSYSFYSLQFHLKFVAWPKLCNQNVTLNRTNIIRVVHISLTTDWGPFQMTGINCQKVEWKNQFNFQVQSIRGTQNTGPRSDNSTAKIINNSVISFWVFTQYQYNRIKLTGFKDYLCDSSTSHQDWRSQLVFWDSKHTLLSGQILMCPALYLPYLLKYIYICRMVE